MRRGDIYLVRFASGVGSEAVKDRPAIIVSNDTTNVTVDRLRRGVLVVVPLTSNVSRVYSFQVLVQAFASTGLDRDSKAQIEQVRAIDVQRLMYRMGFVDQVEMNRVSSALREHLS